MKSRFLMTALLAFSLGACFAQDYRGKVQGIVTDASQAVIAGVHLKLINVNTGVVVTRESNGFGNYLFDFVQPGVYRLEAETAGFAKSIREDVRVEATGDVTVNFTLQPGPVSQSVTVSADSASLQFNTTSKELTVRSPAASTVTFCWTDLAKPPATASTV